MHLASRVTPACPRHAAFTSAWSVLMALTSASSIAFAVAGGMPADAREWITVDMAGHPTSGRRGYLVATEPVGQTGRALELATQAREIIVGELRRLHRAAPDEALGRALASANGAIYEQTRGALLAGADRRVLVGVTAIIFENHTATIAHVPPGQLILVEDGLVYSVPNLESWFPRYAVNGDAANQPEPLGFASWTSPLIAQTELRPGDTIVACSSETGQAFAEEVVTSGFNLRDLTYLHHRDPEIVLDAVRGVVIARDLNRSAVAVVSFPPLPEGAQINTFADIGRRSRERWRHGRAHVSQWRPMIAPSRGARSSSAMGDVVEESAAVATPLQPALVAESIDAQLEGGQPNHGALPKRRVKKDRVEQRLARAQARMQRIADWGGPHWRQTWNGPSPMSQFGVPGAHGVNRFRGQATYTGEMSWRNRLPRLPVIGSNWIWPVLLMLIVGAIFGSLLVRERMLVEEIDQGALVAAIDEEILEARDLENDDDVVTQLAAAQRDLDNAREAGVTEELLSPRQQAITEQLDGATDVIRMSDLQRIGTLPEEFDQASVRGVNTPAGIFFVAGNLYQWRPGDQADQRAIDVILKQGDTIGTVTVGSLWGLAFDAKGLYVTDGAFVFMLATDSQEWRAVQLGRINNQPWKPGAMAAFDGSIYLLQSEYVQIYRFGVEDATDTAAPRDWLVSGREDLDDSGDIAIDGNVYVLLKNGRVLLLFRGELTSTLEPQYVETGTSESIVNGAATGYTYISVTDGDNSRIVAFDQQGSAAYQLRLPMGFSTNDVSVRAPFDGLQDVVVDESTGTFFIINGDAIWTARYSLPTLPERDSAMPEPGQ